MHINSVDKGVWDVIINGPHEITMTSGEGVVVPKSKNQWNDNAYLNVFSVKLTEGINNTNKTNFKEQNGNFFLLRD